MPCSSSILVSIQSLQRTTTLPSLRGPRGFTKSEMMNKHKKKTKLKTPDSPPYSASRGLRAAMDARNPLFSLGSDLCQPHKPRVLLCLCISKSSFCLFVIQRTMSSQPVTTFWRIAGMSYLQVRREQAPSWWGPFWLSFVRMYVGRIDQFD